MVILLQGKFVLLPHDVSSPFSIRQSTNVDVASNAPLQSALLPLPYGLSLDAVACREGAEAVRHYDDFFAVIEDGFQHLVYQLNVVGISQTRVEPSRGQLGRQNCKPLVPQCAQHGLVVDRPMECTMDHQNNWFLRSHLGSPFDTQQGPYREEMAVKQRTAVPNF